jgi:hypothetical protein
MIFFCTFAAAVCGMVLRQKLPDDAKTPRMSNKLAMGLIATWPPWSLACSLPRQSSYETQSGELQQVSATIVEFDGILAQYGPEANEPRHGLRAAVSVGRRTASR